MRLSPARPGFKSRRGKFFPKLASDDDDADDGGGGGGDDDDDNDEVEEDDDEDHDDRKSIRITLVLYDFCSGRTAWEQHGKAVLFWFSVSEKSRNKAREWFSFWTLRRKHERYVLFARQKPTNMVEM